MLLSAHMFLRLQNPSSVHNRLRFFHSQHIPLICLPSSISGFSLVGDLLVQLVGHTIRMNFGFKSKPSGIPFLRITYRACMIQCHDMYRFSLLSLADIKRTDFWRYFCFLFCKFGRLFVLLSEIYGINFINFSLFLHGDKIFTNMSVYKLRIYFLSHNTF